MLMRIARTFAELKKQNRAGFVAFVAAGDPDYATSLEILNGLPDAGADVIELGMPFTDPMADGPAVQAASLRALKGGQTMKKTLDLVRAFRTKNTTTPLVLMGYYNPIYSYGVDKFVRDATAAGVDGLILVDLPPEEDHEIRPQAKAAGLDIIRLATPTTDAHRLTTVARDATGFLYYVSIAGITGSKSIVLSDVAASLKRLRAGTSLPVAVGFGIKTEADAAGVAKLADAAVVGSALVAEIGRVYAEDGKISPGAREAVLSLARRLAAAVHTARS